jgi:hypothetical protein
MLKGNKSHFRNADKNSLQSYDHILIFNHKGKKKDLRRKKGLNNASNQTWNRRGAILAAPVALAD